mmetsp:Transcript_9996/g.27218  ORF Transcript_9996/g.27218 Transcript_9996/m.27218 type:complete len:258 (-) Transcript_9996:503-1276(-)
MRLHLLKGGALVRVHLQHPRQQVLGSRAEVGWHAELALNDLLAQLLLVARGGVEGQVAGQARKQHHAQRPHVHRRAVVLLAGHNLWCCVGGTAAVHAQALARDEESTQTKVNYFHVAIRAEQNVLQLHVPVHHLPAVAVLQACHDLLKNEGSLALCQALARTHIVQQGLVGCMLHYQVQRVGRVHDLKQLDDALVREVQHDADLALDALGLVHVCELCLVDDLDGHLAFAEVMYGQPHLAEAAFSNDLAHGISWQRC